VTSVVLDPPLAIMAELLPLRQVMASDGAYLALVVRVLPRPPRQAVVQPKKSFRPCRTRATRRWRAHRAEADYRFRRTKPTAGGSAPKHGAAAGMDGRSRASW